MFIGHPFAYTTHEFLRRFFEFLVYFVENSIYIFTKFLEAGFRFIHVLE